MPNPDISVYRNGDVFVATIASGFRNKFSIDSLGVISDIEPDITGDFTNLQDKDGKKVTPTYNVHLLYRSQSEVNDSKIDPFAYGNHKVNVIDQWLRAARLGEDGCIVHILYKVFAYGASLDLLRSFIKKVSKRIIEISEILSDKTEKPIMNLPSIYTRESVGLTFINETDKVPSLEVMNLKLKKQKKESYLKFIKTFKPSEKLLEKHPADKYMFDELYARYCVELSNMDVNQQDYLMSRNNAEKKIFEMLEKGIEYVGILDDEASANNSPIIGELTDQLNKQLDILLEAYKVKYDNDIDKRPSENPEVNMSSYMAAIKTILEYESGLDDDQINGLNETKQAWEDYKVKLNNVAGEIERNNEQARKEAVRKLEEKRIEEAKRIEEETKRIEEAKRMEEEAAAAVERRATTEPVNNQGLTDLDKLLSNTECLSQDKKAVFLAYKYDIDKITGYVRVNDLRLSIEELKQKKFDEIDKYIKNEDQKKEIKQKINEKYNRDKQSEAETQQNLQHIELHKLDEQAKKKAQEQLVKERRKQEEKNKQVLKRAEIPFSEHESRKLLSHIESLNFVNKEPFNEDLLQSTVAQRKNEQKTISEGVPPPPPPPTTKSIMTTSAEMTLPTPPPIATTPAKINTDNFLSSKFTNKQRLQYLVDIFDEKINQPYPPVSSIKGPLLQIVGKVKGKDIMAAILKAEKMRNNDAAKKRKDVVNKQPIIIPKKTITKSSLGGKSKKQNYYKNKKQTLKHYKRYTRRKQHK